MNICTCMDFKGLQRDTYGFGITLFRSGFGVLEGLETLESAGCITGLTGVGSRFRFPP